MKPVIFTLICLLSLTACYSDEQVYTAEPTMANPNFGCLVVTDDFGEREVCDTHYYYAADGSPIWWDNHFGIWVSSSGYWYGGRWFVGFYPGYHSYYHAGFYRPRGYFHGNYHGYRGNYRGGYHGGGFHGGHGGHR